MKRLAAVVPSRVTAVALGMVAVFVMGAQAQPHSYLPLDHWAYGALARFVSWGLIPSYLLASKPLTREEVARLILMAREGERGNLLGPADRELLQALWEEFSPEIAQPSGGRGGGSVTVGVSGRAGTVATLTTPPSQGLPSGVEGQVSVGLGAVALDASAGAGGPSIRRLALSGAFGPVRVELGREALWWGPGTRGALLLSDSAGPLDMVRLTWDASRFRFTKVLAQLDQPGRYLAGTRVDWQVSPSVRVALSETAVAFPSPIFWYHLVNPAPAVLTDLLGMWDLQSRWGANDNFLVGVDFDARIRPGVLLYGEIMYDDIQSWQPLLEGITLFPTNPSRYGLQAGLYLADPFRDGRTEVRLEYARIYNWTYGHGLSDRRYDLRGRPLGHWLGPDGDDLAVIATRRLSPREDLEVWAALTRHGEGRIDRGPASPEDAWRNRFLSGTVETRYSLGASWTRRSGPNTVGVSAELAYVRNRMNVANDDGPGFFLGLTYSWTW